MGKNLSKSKTSMSKASLNVDTASASTSARPVQFPRHHWQSQSMRQYPKRPPPPPPAQTSSTPPLRSRSSYQADIGQLPDLLPACAKTQTSQSSPMPLKTPKSSSRQSEPDTTCRPLRPKTAPERPPPPSYARTRTVSSSANRSSITSTSREVAKLRRSKSLRCKPKPPATRRLSTPPTPFRLPPERPPQPHRSSLINQLQPQPSSNSTTRTRTVNSLPSASLQKLSTPPRTLEVVITNLGVRTRKKDLSQVLGSGKVVSQLVPSSDGHKVATVLFRTYSEADKAVQTLNGKPILDVPAATVLRVLGTVNPITPKSYREVTLPGYIPDNSQETDLPRSQTSTQLQPNAGTTQDICRHLVQRKDVSLHRWKFIAAKAKQDFQRNGGSLKYCSDNCLLIYSNSRTEAQQFASLVVDMVCERQLALSSKQWCRLTDNDSAEYSKLCALFSTDAKVEIYLEENQSLQKNPAVVFVGERDAVDGAFRHFKNAISVSTKRLDCKPIIHSYLALVLLKPDPETESFISSLPAEVTISKEKRIELEGKKTTDITESEERLLSHFVPPHLKYKTFEFHHSLQLYSLIEKFVLRSHSGLPGFRYLGPEKLFSSLSAQFGTGFSFTVFSLNSEHFTQICGEIESLHLCTEEMPTNPFLTSILEKKKEYFEEKHRVGLRIHPRKIEIDGLHCYNVENCRKEIDKIVFVAEIPLKGFQVMYLKMKYQRKLEEMKRACENFTIPAATKSQSCLDSDYIVFVKGRRRDVEQVETELQQIFDDDLKDDSFSVRCCEGKLLFREREWNYAKIDFETKHKILVWFQKGCFSPSTDRASRQQLALYSKYKKVTVDFKIYGKSASVGQFRKAIEDMESEEMIEEKIYLPSIHLRQSIKAAIANKQLEISDSVSVNFCQASGQSSILLLHAYSPNSEDVKAAKSKIEGFICMLEHRKDVKYTSTTSIPCEDKLVALVLSKNPELVKEALPLKIKKCSELSFQMDPNPFFKLTTTSNSSEDAKLSIEALMGRIQADMGTVTVDVEPLLKPFFYGTAYPRLCSQLKEKYHVLVNFPSNLKPGCCNSRQSSALGFPTGLMSLEPICRSLGHEHEMITVVLKGPKQNLKEAEDMLKERLSGCKKIESIPLKSSSDSIKKEIKQVADKHGVHVTFRGQDYDSSATVQGVDTAVASALPEMQKVVIGNIERLIAEGQMTKFPQEWEPQSTIVEIFDVSKGTREWQTVSGKFKASMRRSTIRRIQRIQNMCLWEKYAQEKKRMEKKNNGAHNEKDLFHGSSKTKPHNIYNSESGFDMRFSAEGMWGIANYFAVDASYSNSYVYSSSHQKQMFLAKVLTGDSFHSSPNSALRMPPLKRATAGVQLDQVRYDTVRGHTNGCEVYMTYDNHKAYPAYLITYM